MGYHRNDRIAVITPAGPETAVIIISVMAGFTSVPLNPQSKKQEYESYFSQLKIKAIIVQRGSETTAVWVAKSRNIPIIELLPVPDKAGKFELKPTVLQDTQEAEFATPSDISHVLSDIRNYLPAKNSAHFAETILLLPGKELIRH